MPEMTTEGKIKKEKVVTPPTKVVIRHLPPYLTKEEFLDVASPLPAHDWIEFCDGEKGLTGHQFRRAYLNITDVDEIHRFRDQYDGYVFVDQKGNESQAIVEFAPFQKLSHRDQSPKRKDPRMGTIQDDLDYLEFLHKLENPETVQLPGTEKMLEEIEAHERILRENHGVPTTRTPLVEYLEQRRADALQHKLDTRSLYDYGGRQGEKMRRREERREMKEMKRLQRLERRKIKQDKENVGRRNTEMVENEYYDEDEHYDQMEEEEDGEYSHKNGYNKSKSSSVGSKWAKKKEVPSIVAKRARRTERRRKEREERAQLEEQQQNRISSAGLTTTKESLPMRRSKVDDDRHHEKNTAEDDEGESKTPKRGAHESTSGGKRATSDRTDEPEEKTRYQGNRELQAQSDAEEVGKTRRYSVLKRKLEEKNPSNASSSINNTQRTDAGADIKDPDDGSNNNTIHNGSGNDRSSSSDVGKDSESSHDSSKSTNKSETKSGELNKSGTAESLGLILDESSPRLDANLRAEKSDSKSDDNVGDLSSSRNEGSMQSEQDDAALKSEKEYAEDERERDKSVERITRTMKHTDEEGVNTDNDGGRDAMSPKDDITSPKLAERSSKERTAGDPRTERKIKNKDRPAMQLYRPGQSRLVSRLTKEPGGGGRTADGAVSAGSGSVGSGGGRSSCSSTSSPEVPVDNNEKEGRMEAEDPDPVRSKPGGRGKSAGGRESPVLTGANRVHLSKDIEQQRRKTFSKTGGEKKYRDNYYEEDDGKSHKNLSGKGDSYGKSKKFPKSNEYESKYSKAGTNNRGKTNDFESGTSFTKSGSSHFSKSKYDTPQYPIKNTTASRSFRVKVDRDDHHGTSKDGSSLKDPKTNPSIDAKEAKPQGKRYSRMRAAEGSVRSTPSSSNKGKEVVVIHAEE